MVLPKDHYLFRKASLPMETVRKQTKSACLQCKMCTELCPRYLIGHQIHPNLMMRGLWLEPTITDNEEYLRMYGEAANCCSCGVCEMFACPMGLSPRKVNDYFKAEFRKRGIQVPKNPEAHAREFVQERKTPTNRLVARLEFKPVLWKTSEDMRGTDSGYRIYPVFTAHRATGSRCETGRRDRCKG